ncbi:hypothetical protein J437_LFUL018167 [Ladona fulva]|nr:hypothetical protein J437_LFUL018167 [Ladona fulva]
MEYIHHVATEKIILPPKISPVFGKKTFSKAIVEPAQYVEDIELNSASPEESKEDESIEDFVRSVLRDRIHGTLPILQQRDRRCSKLGNVAGGDWKSWTEL